jgi:hypothetical protein
MNDNLELNAQRAASLIIALDEQLRSTEFSRKRFQFFNRRGQLGQRKTRERFDSHQTFLPLMGKLIDEG